ncbi:hypothetical protein [Clostridium sp.]|uniref:hypothetical protein n=1 Tax=Clostridium sp. TaxID=1506 RepID=UPI002FC7EA93
MINIKIWVPVYLIGLIGIFSYERLSISKIKTMFSCKYQSLAFILYILLPHVALAFIIVHDMLHRMADTLRRVD